MNEPPSQPDDVSRPPSIEDLLLICRNLNEREARYIVIGGLAIYEHGLARMTEGIDLLVDPSAGNISRVKAALQCLPDQASREVLDTDVSAYVVVRINDEITVDLMASACGVSYEDAKEDIEWRLIRDVRIPFASPVLLWKTKQTYREKDALDRAFLRKWFAERGLEPPETKH